MYPYVNGTKAHIGWWLTLGEESGIDGRTLSERRCWRPSFMVDWSACRYLDRWDRKNRPPVDPPKPYYQTNRYVTSTMTQTTGEIPKRYR